MADATRVHLPDLEDLAPRFGFSHVGEARFARDALGCEQSGLSLQRIAPGARQAFGHRHRDEEEVYVVLSGSGTLRFQDEEISVGALDAVRVAPGAMRAFEAGPDGLELLAFGARGLGAADAEMAPGWWGGEAA